MKRYPNIELTGLKVKNIFHRDDFIMCQAGPLEIKAPKDFVLCEDLEAFLQQAPEIEIEAGFINGLVNGPKTEIRSKSKARLICVQEIKPVTAEELLREYFEADQDGGRNYLQVKERVKAFLGGE